MNIFLGGIRGTGPVAGKDFAYYGGETTALLIEGIEGGRILLDGGTGVRLVGPRLAKTGERRSLLWLMTHYHLDHVMGMPSLPQLYQKDWRIEMASPLREGFSIRETVGRLLSKPFWPVQLSQLQSAITFRTLKGSTSKKPLEWEGFSIRWCPVNHPDGCTAYRITENATGRSLVFATDIEWPLSTRAQKEALLHLCREPGTADVLFMDGQFTREEYPAFRGWGHSAWEDAVELAHEVGVQRVSIIHHAPSNADAVLRKRASAIRRCCVLAELARGGECITLS